MDTIRVANLKTQAGISAEMRNIYRLTRRSEINADYGKLLMGMLKALSENHVAVELEEKVEEIETQKSFKTR